MSYKNKKLESGRSNFSPVIFGGHTSPSVILSGREGSMDSSANAFRMTGETGRSMVEMLGVLAIIGVLSVGGIAGYTMAMNKYKANEILEGASMRAMIVSAQLQLNANATPNIGEFTDKPAGATFNPTITKGTGTFTFSVSDVAPAVCDQMKAVISDDSKNPVIDCEANPITLTYNNDLGRGSTATGGGNTNPDITTCANGATPVLKTYKTGSCCIYTTKEMCPETPVPGCTPDANCNTTKENCAGSWAQQESEYHFQSNDTGIPDDEKMSICCLEGTAHCGGAGCLCAPTGASVAIGTAQPDEYESDKPSSIICDTGRAMCPHQGPCICLPQGMGGCCADFSCIIIPPDRDGGCEGANTTICDIGEKWCDEFFGCAETCEIE